jgi:hypothetical protein
LALKWCENLLTDEKVFPQQSDDNVTPFPKDYLKIVKEICKKLFRIYAHAYVDHNRQNTKSATDFGFKHFMCFNLQFALLSETEMTPLKNWITHELGVSDWHRYLKEQKKATKELQAQKQSNKDKEVNNLLSVASSSALNRSRRHSRVRMPVKLLVKDRKVTETFSDNLSTLIIKIEEARGLGAKDLSGTSDPYCIVKMGDEEMRTSTVWKNCSPVWDESFTFVLDSAAKQEENGTIVFKVFDQNLILKGSFIGMYEYKISDLLDEKLHDMWFVLHGEDNEVKSPRNRVSPRGKPSESSEPCGELHVKLQYVSSERGRMKYLSKMVNLSHYSKLKQFIGTLSTRRFVALFDLGCLSHIDSCWKSILLVAQAKDEVFVHDVLETVIKLEVSQCSTPATLFRSNTISSKLMGQAMRVYGGLEYLDTVLSPVIKLVCQVEELLEVNPSRITPDEQYDVESNMAKILNFSQLFLDSIVHHTDVVPPMITTMIHHVRKAAELKFPDDKNIGFISTSGLLFLRFICPALIAPQLYGLPTCGTNKNAQRNLMLISKILQQLANQVLFKDKEVFMHPANAFIEKNTEKLHLFFDSVNNKFDADLLDLPAIPEEQLLLSYFTVHELYYKSLDALENVVMDVSSDELLLKNIHFHSDEAFNVSSARQSIVNMYDLVKELGQPPQLSLSERQKVKTSFSN